jgi:hypothetical protein
MVRQFSRGQARKGTNCRNGRDLFPELELVCDRRLPCTIQADLQK